MTTRNQAREYPKCIYKDGKICNDNIMVVSVKDEIKANNIGYWDHKYGKIEEMEIAVMPLKDQAVIMIDQVISDIKPRKKGRPSLKRDI